MILDALFPRAVAPPPGDDFWYQPLGYDITGEVTPDTSLQVATVFACVRVLSETIAQLPLHLMRTDGVKKSKAIDSPLYEVLHDRPNRRQTSFEWREQMQTHLTLRGNAYSLIRWGGSGQVDELIPLHPDRMEVFLLDNNVQVPHTSRIGYLYRDEKNARYRILSDEMLHIKFMSLEGIVGVSPISWGRKAIELSMQAEKHGLSWWKNAAKPGGVIRMPPGEYLDEDAHKRMKSSWRAAHTADDLYTVAVLEGGAEWQPMGISNEDSEWLESRRFQIAEICRLFRVPPHMVASAIEHGNTYANIEQSDLDFVKHSLLPWVGRWEQSIQRSLLGGQSDLYPRFNLDGLLRADLESRSAFYQALWNMGVLSINEIREKEDIDPIDDGDKRFVPSGYVPIDQAGVMPTQPAAPVAPPEDDTADERLGVPIHWAADIADRLANAQIRELECQVHRGGGVVEGMREFFTGRHRKYVIEATSPFLAAVESPVAASAIAAVVEQSGMEYLETTSPQEALNAWRQARAEQLRAILMRVD